MAENGNEWLPTPKGNVDFILTESPPIPKGSVDEGTSSISSSSSSSGIIPELVSKKASMPGIFVSVEVSSDFSEITSS
ncbi:MAG: Uncharacterised protein [Methanobacteriota archaeon]|nr:MAG: Uncharacterised protein [Euryarchaeota archaeon]